MVEAKADLEREDKDARTALSEAASNQETALSEAASNQEVEVVQFLLQTRHASMQ